MLCTVIPLSCTPRPLLRSLMSKFARWILLCPAQTIPAAHLTQALLRDGFHPVSACLSLPFFYFHQKLVALRKLELVCIKVKLLQGTMVFTQTWCHEYTCPDYECKLYMGWSLKCLSKFLVLFSPRPLQQIDEEGWQLVSAAHRREQCAWKRKHVLRSRHGSPLPDPPPPMTSHHPDCHLSVCKPHCECAM